MDSMVAHPRFSSLMLISSLLQRNGYTKLKWNQHIFGFHTRMKVKRFLLIKFLA